MNLPDILVRRRQTSPGAGTIYVAGCRGLAINEAGGENLVVELQDLDFGDRALAPGSSRVPPRRYVQAGRYRRGHAVL